MKKNYGYCENDCAVVYQYIKKELERYKTVKDIPITATGHVRRELKEYLKNNYKYKYKVKNVINTDGHIYNLMVKSFAGRLYTF